MDPQRNTAPIQVSLPRLVAMFFSPLAMRHLLERPARSGDRLAAVGVRYRNSQLLFRHIDSHINRSAAVVLVCFFLQPVVALLGLGGLLHAALAVLTLAAILHAGALGIYRQVLHERIEACAEILGMEQPDDRDVPQAFPRSDLDRKEPTLKSTRKLPLRNRRKPGPPR